MAFDSSGQPEVVADLIAVKNLLSDPKSWARGWLALDANGEPYDVSPRSSNAKSWCLYGAIERVTRGREDITKLGKINKVLCEAHPSFPLAAPGDVIRFNNDLHTTHDDLMAFLDKAIAVASAGAQHHAV